MSKQVKSYSLSKKAIDRIKEVQQKEDYKSDSEALEAIILGKTSDAIESKIRAIVMKVLQENQLSVTVSREMNKITEAVDEVENNIVDSINDIFNQMK